MSYARFGWDGSDVYVFLSVTGAFECCACSLNKRLPETPQENQEEPDTPSKSALGNLDKVFADSAFPQFTTTAAMISHLDEHRAQGDHVPEYTYERLRQEAEENDQWIAENA